VCVMLSLSLCLRISLFMYHSLSLSFLFSLSITPCLIISPLPTLKGAKLAARHNPLQPRAVGRGEERGPRGVRLEARARRRVSPAHALPHDVRRARRHRHSGEMKGSIFVGRFRSFLVLFLRREGTVVSFQPLFFKLASLKRFFHALLIIDEKSAFSINMIFLLLAASVHGLHHHRFLSCKRTPTS